MTYPDNVGDSDRWQDPRDIQDGATDQPAPTPRTDAAEYDTGIRLAEDYHMPAGTDMRDMVVPADFARQLERENADLRARLEAAERDAERIGLIERTGCYPFKSGSMWTFIIAEQNSSQIQARGTGLTARAAIDAATRKEEGNG